MTKKSIATAVVVVLAASLTTLAAARGERWSDEELEIVRGLSLARLKPLPVDPTNRVADDPRAVELGQRLFFDTRLSSNGKVSCATCHVPDREFQDGTPLAKGVGTTDRRTMPVAGTAYSPFLFWDGRKDSQWAQALGPLESAVEHGGSRAQYAHVIAEHYRDEYERTFGPLPELRAIPRGAGPVPDPAARAAWDAMTDEQRVAVTQVYVNIGKAIAAYERRLQYGPSRFDRYAEALSETGRAPADVLTRDEVAGLRLFIGKANCTQCHDGPLFTNNEFHNTGVPAPGRAPHPALRATLSPQAGRGETEVADHGRTTGARGVLADEFNCRSRWSDAKGGQCSELEFLVSEGHTLERAFKVPSLRNVAERAPYMHAGQFATLEEVVAHYNRAPEAPAGHSELKPLRLNATELQQLAAFLRTLSGGTDAPAGLLRDPHQQ
jgi:cytochrome c peroxidase